MFYSVKSIESNSWELGFHITGCIFIASKMLLLPNVISLLCFSRNILKIIIIYQL